MDGFVWKTLTIDSLSSENEWKIIDIYVLLTDIYAQEVLSHLPTVVKQNCNGCIIEHPSQHEHPCSMNSTCDNLDYYFNQAVAYISDYTVFKKTYSKAVNKLIIDTENVVMLTEDRPCKDDASFMIDVFNRAYDIASLVEDV